MLDNANIQALTNELSRLTMAVQDLVATPDKQIEALSNTLRGHIAAADPHQHSPDQERLARFASGIPTLSAHVQHLHDLVVQPGKESVLKRLETLEGMLFQALPEILISITSLATLNAAQPDE